MKPVFQTGKIAKGISVDPRTKLFILLVGNITVLVTPSLQFEILMAAAIMIFGLLCGVYRFSLKMLFFYVVIVAVQITADLYLPVALRTLFVTFAIFVRKIFPCVMLGGILISTTRVNEFMAAMNRIHMPKYIVIPLTVMLRYFPMISEEWSKIKDAMRMRGISPNFVGLIKSPLQTIECVYVPLMMSASKVADDLSAAAVTRGIENPKPRTCLQQIRFGLADAIFALCFTALLFGAILI